MWSEATIKDGEARSRPTLGEMTAQIAGNHLTIGAQGDCPRSRHIGCRNDHGDGLGQYDIVTAEYPELSVSSVDELPLWGGIHRGATADRAGLRAGHLVVEVAEYRGGWDDVPANFGRPR